MTHRDPEIQPSSGARPIRRPPRQPSEIRREPVFGRGVRLLRRIKRTRRTVLPQRGRPIGDNPPDRLRQRLAVRETRRIERRVQQHRRPQSDVLTQAPEM